MFNIGFGELAIICIVLIIAVGPERLPSMMKTLGKTLRTLRQASRDIRASTGIDDLLREDFDLYAPPPPPRRPAALQHPAEPPAVTPAPDPSAAANPSEAATSAAAPATPAQPAEPKPISREDAIEPPAPPAPAITPDSPATTGFVAASESQAAPPEPKQSADTPPAGVPGAGDTKPQGG